MFQLAIDDTYVPLHTLLNCPYPLLCSDGPCNYNNPCQNGGSCENTGISQYQCLCAEGLGGFHCEIEATQGKYYKVYIVLTQS